MGPKVQYANEKKGALDLRIYPGEDAEFTYYDDERDNYNYEDGKYATIKISWEDENKMLKIGDRKGSYNGMSPEISMNITVMGKNTLFTFEPSNSRKINFEGEALEIQF